MGILKYLLFSIPFLIALGAFGQINLQNSVNFYSYEVIVGVIFFYVLIKYKYYRNKFLELTFIPFVVVCAFSLLLNFGSYSVDHLFISSLYLVRFIAFSSILLFVLKLTPSDKKKLLFCVITALILFCLFGLYQYITYPSLRNYYVYGWDNHLYRLTSTFLDPNFAGLAVVFLFFLLIYEFGIAFKEKKLFYTLLLVEGLYLSLLSFLLTYSRSAFLALGVGIVPFFLSMNKRVLIAIVLSMSIIAFIFIPKDIKTEGLNPFRVTSSVERFKSIQNGLKVFSNAPLYGVGFNAYRFAQKNMGLLDSHWESTHAGAGVSNAFVFVMATTGILGLISFIFLIYRLGVFILKNGKSRQYALCLFGIFTAIIIHSLFENTFFYASILILMYMLIGVMDYKKQ